MEEVETLKAIYGEDFRLIGSATSTQIISITIPDSSSGRCLNLRYTESAEMSWPLHLQQSVLTTWSEPFLIRSHIQMIIPVTLHQYTSWGDSGTTISSLTLKQYRLCAECLHIQSCVIVTSVMKSVFDPMQMLRLAAE